jgi:DNA-binding NtrC family response regulator
MTPTINESLNILIVDDEVNIRKTLSVCLETEGHKVIAVSNFQDALAKASRRSFEMVFMGLRKPFTPAQVNLTARNVFEMRTLEQRVAWKLKERRKAND